MCHIVVLICIYVILASSLNIVIGYTGLLSLCHAAFYGFGAYATALLIVNAHLPFFVAVLAAAILTGIISLIIGGPSLRLKGDYFVLATLGFQIIIYDIFYNWTGLTGGAYGITNISPPSLFGLVFNSPFSFAILALLCASSTVAVYRLLVKSPFGRLLRSVRDDELAAASLGKNTYVIKLIAFGIGAFFASIAGSLYAGYITFIDPSSFTVMESIFVLSVVIIGGAGSLMGPVVGAIVLVLLPESLRFLHVPDTSAANVREIIYGMLLILMMRFRPQGLLGDYAFD